MLKKSEKCPSQHQIINPKTEIHIEMEHSKTADYLGMLKQDNVDIYNDIYVFFLFNYIKTVYL